MMLNLAENKFKCGLWVGIIFAQEFIKFLLQLMRQMDVDIFVTGHIHQFKAYKHEGGVVINPGSATGVHSSITYDANPSFVLLDIGLRLLAFCETRKRLGSVDQLHRGMEGTGKPRSDSCVSDDRKLPRVWVPQMKTTALGPVRSRISYADWDREQGNEVPTKRLLHRARIGCVG
ncbi:hypothetical protein OPV22_028175 [Ensete ventricosum]|uniref:Vacuolar protein sorting-associated protein 29 n=1 Tax=Ensete ventricosum TaxID=4639 RepID=A0AAV8PXH2_ENSVE|nr:hypothetical protein OPV22_028175 [Ensete ventricosum]